MVKSSLENCRAIAWSRAVARARADPPPLPDVVGVEAHRAVVPDLLSQVLNGSDHNFYLFNNSYCGILYNYPDELDGLS